MSTYVYSINSMGLQNLVFFASKRAALQYARTHSFCPKINGRYILFKSSPYIAQRVRDDWSRNKETIENDVQN